MDEIPEIDIKLESHIIKSEIRPLPLLRFLYKNGNIFEKIKFIARYVWFHSGTKSWDDFLDSKIKWLPELAQDVSVFHNIDAEAELTKLLKENIRKEMGEEAYQAQQLDIAKQCMDKIDPSWRELQSNKIKEEIDAEILKQLREAAKDWKEGKELTTLERWDLMKKYHAGKHTIPWDRMALPTHKWFDEYTTIYNTNIPITIPKYSDALSNDEIGYLQMVANYREEDKKLREENKKNE